jgi:starch-binding outer membrane protein, SusD/RagB family
MKRIIIILSIVFFYITGCEKLKFGNEFLSKAPGIDVTQDTVFAKLEYAERFLWSAYRTLRYGLNTSDGGGKDDLLRRDYLESITDLCQSYLMDGGAVRMYYNGGYTSSESSMSKYNLTAEGAPDGIRKAYIFMDNIDRVPDCTPEYARQLKAEALMVIACHYHEMYRNIGGAPYISHAYSVSETGITIPRLTAQATCDTIVAMCDRAARYLPWIVSNPAEWDGRFTKAAAMGLKARILLFNASPLFNSDQPYLDGQASQEKLTWHGSYDANRWKQAMDAAHDLIAQAEATGDYKIYHKAGNTPRMDFREAYFLRGNGEMLISNRQTYKAQSGTSQTQGYYFYASVSWGCGLVTQEGVDIFPMSNGLPITDLAAGYNPNDPYKNRDVRLYETAVVNGDSYKGRTAELWIGGRERTNATNTGARTGYPMRKFILDSDVNTSYGAVVHWPYLRLAEIYLSYAEASNEFNNGPTAESYRCINVIRNRVGLPNLAPGMTKEQFREACLVERACEFAFEEVRWYDLIRWKREDIFKKTLHGCDITRTAVGPPMVFKYTYWNLMPRYWQTNFSPKWYLSAIPAGEVLKGYGLIQNPGW